MGREKTPSEIQMNEPSGFLVNNTLKGRIKKLNQLTPQNFDYKPQAKTNTL